MEQNPEITQMESAIDEQKHVDGVITLVLTADNHLGYNESSQPPRKRELRKQQLRHAFQQATDFAIGQGVDFFIQAGDLFDSSNPDEQDRSFVAEQLAQIRNAGIQTVAIGGIHDTSVETISPLDREVSDSASPVPAPQLSYARLGAMHFFAPTSGALRSKHADQVYRNQPLEPVFFDIRGILVAMCGLSVLADQEGDPLEKLQVQSDIERAAISLLLLHAPIEGFEEDPRLVDIHTQVNRASLANQSIFRYILAGYHHAYKHSSIGHCDLIVAGATQHIGFDDPGDEPGFVFIGLAADGIRWCKHIAVESLLLRRLVVPAIDLKQQGTEAEQKDVTESVLALLRPLCADNAMVQLCIEGELTRERYHQLDLNQIRQYGEEHCFALSIDDSRLSFLSEQEMMSSLNGFEHGIRRDERFSPREELTVLADEWIAAAGDEQERNALQATKEELLAALRQM